MSGKDSRREEAKNLSLQKGWTQETIAQHFGVTTRTIERWASQDGWGARKHAEKVVSIGQAKKKIQQPKPESTHNGSTAPIRSRRSAGEIDELNLVDLALSDISAFMSSGEMDARGIGSCATALCRLIELRLKLKPRSAAELAELAIGLGMSPAEFARELRQAWEKRA